MDKTLNNNVSDLLVPSAVALGVFDGVHKGHTEVISQAVRMKDSGLVPAVFTFKTESIPRKHGARYDFLMPNSCKLDIIKNLGIEYVLCKDYGQLSGLDAERFVTDILCREMKARHVVCGEGFHFGKGAVCSVDDLRYFGSKYGFDVTAVSPVEYNGRTISSTLIKQYLSDGDIKSANAMLGRSYSIRGLVVYGNQIGRTIEFPTINQNFCDGQVLPKFGVYASRLSINGKMYASITNVGVKPTVTSENIPLAETHIIDYSGNLYGTEAEVFLVDFIRSETHFNSLDELKNAILHDVWTVRKLNVI